MCAHQFRFSKHVIEAKNMIEREQIAIEVSCSFCRSRVPERELAETPEFRQQTKDLYDNLRCWGFHCSKVPAHAVLMHRILDLRQTWNCCPKRFLESHELALMQLVNLKLKYNFELPEFEEVEKEVMKRIAELAEKKAKGTK